MNGKKARALRKETHFKPRNQRKYEVFGGILYNNLHTPRARYQKAKKEYKGNYQDA